jgi:hypothetical protein
MSKVKLAAVPVPPKQKYYTIRRQGSGYAVFDSDGTQCCPENMWQIVVKKLEQLLAQERDEANRGTP